MTQEEELLTLRLENQELHIKIKKHRVMGEQAETDLRALQHQVNKACSLFTAVLERTDPTCILCQTRLAKIIAVLKTPMEDGSPTVPTAVD